MGRDASWTLRFAALVLGTTPFLHDALSRSGGGSVLYPFADLEVLDSMFERAPGGWFFCWLLPFVASLHSLRSDFMTSLFSFVAYLALLISLLCSWVPVLLVGLQTLGVLYLATLLIARVDAEVVAVWARILVGALLLLACGMEYAKEPKMSVGLIGVALGAALSAAGEVWALRSAPPEEPAEGET